MFSFQFEFGYQGKGTDELRKAMLIADKEARATGADAIMPSHLFISLLNREAGIIRDVFKRVGVERDAVRIALHKQFGK